MSRCVFSLHNRTFPGHRDCLDYLIAKGANVNARTKVRHGLARYGETNPRAPHSLTYPATPVPLAPPPPRRCAAGAHAGCCSLRVLCGRRRRVSAVHVDGAALGGDKRAH